MTVQATILSNGSRYYIGVGCCRLRNEYKTPKAAARAAIAKGYSVDMSQLPDPNATSIAHKCIVDFLGNLHTELDGAHISGDLESFNCILRRLGHKPVRITRNTISADPRPLVIDADTPSYLDPGSEANHSM